MSLANVVTQRASSSLGGILAGEDYISSLLFYSATTPSGFASQNIQRIYSISEAVALGIKNDFSDETKATAVLAVTRGSTGDLFKVSINEWSGAVLLANYAQLSTDSTATLVATGIANAINANTYIHGYSAVASVANVTITARAGMGVYLNSGSKITVQVTTSTGGALAITDFTGGVASQLAVMYYHISEYFRMQPNGDLFVMVTSVPSVWDFAEVLTLQRFSQGKIKQLGIYSQVTYSATYVDALQSQLVYLESQNMPLVGILSFDISATTIGALADLSGKNAYMVGVNIAQDYQGLGYNLFSSVKKTIGSIGTMIGTISLASVSQNIGEAGSFNVATTEFNSLAFGTGELYTNQTETGLTTLENKKYTFLRKFNPGYDGSYWNYSYTAVPLTSDYSTIERNRTIQKAIRVCRLALLPKVNSQLVLNSDGTLSTATIETLKSLCSPQLDAMKTQIEISDYSVLINARQNVISTSTLAITLKLVPVGIAKNIVITVGFTLSL